MSSTLSIDLFRDLTVRNNDVGPNPANGNLGHVYPLIQSLTTAWTSWVVARLRSNDSARVIQAVMSATVEDRRTGLGPVL